MDINDLIHDLELTEEDLAEGANIDLQVVQSWCQGHRLPDTEGQEKLVELEKMARLLLTVLPNRAQRREWIDTELRFLGGQTPRQAIRAGQASRTRAAISAAQSGVYL